MSLVPILEVGGTHVSAAFIESSTWSVLGHTRRQVDADAESPVLLGVFASAAAELGAPPGAHWGVAMPGPFDYDRGVAHFVGVGKFEHLNGVDLWTGLIDELTRIGAGRPASVTFTNDASAFLVGEWLTGSARGARRCVGITLGTGIGSAFLADGGIVDSGPDVPPDGEIHLVDHDGRPLEDWVSRRALRRAWAAVSADTVDGADLDVREIADLARAGNPLARGVFHDSFLVLGRVLGPWVQRFGAEMVVLGGSISRSWDLIGAPLHAGLSETGDLTVRLAADAERSALIGAGYPVVSLRP